jgi:putative oxygen-independent coproporphyrinogen III oxidase
MYACCTQVYGFKVVLNKCVLSMRQRNNKLYSTMMEAAPTVSGIYVHIPYCRRRCSYCDFAIVPIGNATKDLSREKGFRSMDDGYKKAVMDEIDIVRTCLDRGQLPKHEVRSIYFGGGTPSLAPLETIEQILQKLIQTYQLDTKSIEITMEMDPGTFTKSQLEALKNLGINRISLGVQSFNDTILEGIGRVHRERDIIDALSIISDVYGDEANISMDLISGLPGLTIDTWKNTLERILHLSPTPNHLSVYDLQIEDGTTFGRWYSDSDEESDSFRPMSEMTSSIDSQLNRDNRLKLPSSEDCALMYRYASEFLRSNGYEHYEISSYARLVTPTSERGFRSVHNQIYWKIGSDWYAFGLSATSSFGGKRFARPRQMSDYISWVQEVKEGVEKLDSLPPWLPQHIDEEDKHEILLDTVMTRLRTTEGLDLNDLKQFSNDDSLVELILEGAKEGIDLGLVERNTTGGGNDILRLVDPDGFLFSNTIISNIFMHLSD